MANAITEATFNDIINTEPRPILVDFWASWCGPCRALAPIVDEVAEEMADRLAVYKCDVDSEAYLAQVFNIMSIPTLIVIKDGKVQGRLVGAMPKDALIAELEKLI